MSNSRRPLGSTYRIQLNGFGFRATSGLIEYLHDLGIETIYLSPIATATHGSSHGYDVVDPTKIDPSLGTADDFEELLQSLESHQMRALIDIVPNHMSTSPENVWWTDVLRHGEKSEFSRFFHIDWDAGGGRVLLPVLEKPFGEALESGDFEIRAEDSGEFFVWYRDRPFPLSPESTSTSGLDQKREILDAQHYRLAYWKVAPWEINYRRFFDINDLVGMRVEDLEVYRRTSALAIGLAADPRVTGVRVDHIDGLADPEDYLARLRQDLSDDRTVLVEKVLARGEQLPEAWASDGTTGYEFADLAFAVLTDPAGATCISGHPYDFPSEARAARGEALDRLFPGQLDRLARQVSEVAGNTLAGRDIPVTAFRDALHALTACLSVYRIYTTVDRNNDADIGRVDAAAQDARENLEDELAIRAILVLRDLLLGLTLDDEKGGPSDELRTNLCIRWQQLCSAVAAKGIEDTALYRFPGLESAADVGSDPGEPAITVGEFHEAMRRRSASGSESLNTTSTHDSKRSEDSRCRLAVLSQLPDVWRSVVEVLRHSHGALAAKEFGSAGVPVEIESLLYQSIVAIWPSGVAWDDINSVRVVDYCIKASREAKLHTSWGKPNHAFEQGLRQFATSVLDSADSMKQLGAFVEEISAAGVVNSLAVVVLKTAGPGVPDFYQGTETWRHLLVDPDNRGPVDFPSLMRRFAALPEGGVAPATELLSRWEDGCIKAFVTRNALQARRDSPDLFARGTYVPVEVRGKHRDRVIAFARQYGEECALAVVPRLSFGVSGKQFPLGEDWEDTVIRLPTQVTRTFRDVFTESVSGGGPIISLRDLLATLPVVLLLGV
jgi:malto-oligosyltrehalose synthase